MIHPTVAAIVVAMTTATGSNAATYSAAIEVPSLVKSPALHQPGTPTPNPCGALTLVFPETQIPLYEANPHAAGGSDTHVISTTETTPYVCTVTFQTNDAPSAVSALEINVNPAQKLTITAKQLAPQSSTATALSGTITLKGAPLSGAGLGASSSPPKGAPSPAPSSAGHFSQITVPNVVRPTSGQPSTGMDFQSPPPTSTSAPH